MTTTRRIAGRSGFARAARGGVAASAAAILVALLVALSSGCPYVDDGAAWVDETHQASTRADALVRRGDREGARRELRAIVELETPESIAAPDRRIVVQDATFRLAELDLGDGHADAAIQWAERGLGLGQSEDVFTANLLVVRGRARETLGRDREAADDFYRALRINEALLRRALGDEG